MKILAKEYDIEEEDFLSAEIEVVPAGEARDTVLTAASSWDMDMMTEYVHTLPLWQCLQWKNRRSRVSACL